MSYTADHAQEFLSNFYLKSKRSVAKAKTEGPAAWVITNDGKRPVVAAQLANLLQAQGCEVHTLNQEITVTQQKSTPAVGSGASRGAGAATPAAAGTVAAPAAAATTTTVKIRAGSYIVRMDQPYSRMADMLLDTQYFNVSDPRPYDDTGWTLGPLRNVATMRVTDASILQSPMTFHSRRRESGRQFQCKRLTILFN